ncbi:ExeM/NucH family extracellular endonuclease [Actinacidiphila acididurans]|uniref:ExeM/NucH family extracellular endonuclease n=1 Tax=Actinacidiphila acididurans TaxID=2784346 RepID=A0ABS2TS63_9ACTN|nr:ExeM/NucH family extracellular endonuclease [Actinacidiphila acididurans]MBM9506177.1 ExeM/NucH family extracellular endonuclease [Actinacidiphila acididurans]
MTHPLPRNPRSRRALIGATGIVLAVTGLGGVVAAPAHANPAGTALVINEVYGGGGNSGATYTNDYIELFNPTDATVDVSGWSVSYYSAKGNLGGSTALTGSIPAHGYYLVQEGQGAGGTTPLPTPDASGQLALSATAGSVTLSDAAGSVVDTVGFGTGAIVEGGDAPAPSNTTAVTRATPGADTDNNNADFVTAAPNPRNSAFSGGGTTQKPAIGAIGPRAATVGTAFSFTPTATGGTSPYTWSATGLPAWASIDAATGRISGTPDATGSASVQLTVTDGTGATGSATFTLTAQAAGTGANHVVISQVWGDGGYTNAPFAHDYIDLYNPTDSAVDLTGWSIGYGAYNRGAGAALADYPISGSIPAHGHFLVQAGADTAGDGAALPTPDATIPVNLNYQGSFVALLDTTAAPTLPAGDISGTAHVVDALGYGDANTFEGEAQGTNLGTDVAALRTPEGADTDDNHTDFTTGQPAPVNSAGQTGTGDSSGDAGNVTIAQIQGTNTDTSPLAGKTATTQGVVTAVYATGGFNGFYLETGGAGGAAADDKTPGASDAVFVYGSQSVGTVTVGESVQVRGTVQEYAGETELTFPTVTQLATPLPPVVADRIAWSDLQSDAQKEAHEGELMAPQGDFTVTDNYNTNFYGQVELAAGDQTLRQPTDAGPAGSAAAQQAADYDASHAITLDDGASVTYSPTGSAANSPLPWLTAGNPVSVGAKATFHQPVVLDYRNSLWNFQPTGQVNGAGGDIVSFSDMRTQNAQPVAVGGKIRLATFNVENYFPMTGSRYVAGGLGSCSYYNDRQGNHIAVNDCGATGPRGAADDASFQRQQEKIVTGINGLGAGIVSLEEVENSVKFGEDRDSALAGLVDALNAKAGAGTWAFAPSPAAADLPPTADQDVIRTAFIYKPAEVSLVGASHVLSNLSGAGQDFSIAREPLAQGFKAVGTADSDAFLVVANHLKSKSNDAAGLYPGDAEDTRPAYDQGGYNETRTHQAQDMLAFAQAQAQTLGTDKLFLVGDFNAYTHEDPMEYLYSQGYTDLGSTDDPNHWSYSYNGLEGSLDHVVASPAALSMVTGATVWQINAQESVGFAYSRYNYNATQLFNAGDPFAASDHDPVVVGIDPGPVKAASEVAVKATPNKVVAGKTQVMVHVTVTAAGTTPTGTVTVTVDGRTYHAALDCGEANIKLAAFHDAGTHTVAVSYSGDAKVLPGTADTTVKVTTK